MELSMRERRELDAKIAVEIFEWTDIEIQRQMVNNNRLGYPPWLNFSTTRQDRNGCKNKVPEYTEKMDLAWRVVEKLKKTLTLRQYPHNRTYATFGHWDNTEDMTEVNGNYCTPVAICLAALAALVVNHPVT